MRRVSQPKWLRKKWSLLILAVSLVATILSHLPYALQWNPELNFVLLPLPVIAVGLALVQQRHAIWLIVSSIATSSQRDRPSHFGKPRS